MTMEMITIMIIINIVMKRKRLRNKTEEGQVIHNTVALYSCSLAIV